MQCSAFFCKRMKHSRVLLRSLHKNVAFFAFFYVLCKRVLHSLRSFPFFRKERERTERSFGSHTVSRQKLEKRTEKNGTFLLKNGKDRGAQPWEWVAWPSINDTLRYTRDCRLFFSSPYTCMAGMPCTAVWYNGVHKYEKYFK